jgi:ferric-dicitrate binding protein FerR (iron transport regulator)
VLLIAAGGAYLLQQKPAEPPVTVAHQQDIPPGTNKATLILGDGSVVTLDSAGNRVISQGGTAIRQQGGQLQYDARGAAAEVTYNTLATPNGGQFKVRLPDGTQAWLNAASSIRYPTTFSGEKRVVEITGEVYLEVARQQGHPFVVQIKTASGSGGEVEVLGTHFNINAYNDEPLIKTTLLEGSVKVTTGNGRYSVLRPGQQSAVNSSGAINILEQVNIGAVIAWKQGYFSFAQTDLRSVMRQIGRWYDVEIVYEGAVPDKKFGGAIPRDSPASEVLKILEVSGVHFRIEGKKIVVIP